MLIKSVKLIEIGKNMTNYNQYIIQNEKTIYVDRSNNNFNRNKENKNKAML